MDETEDQAFERELRVFEAVDVNSSTPVLTLAFAFGFFVQLVQIGPANLPGLAYIPIGIIFVLAVLGFRSYLQLRNRPVPARISDRRLRTIMISSLIMGASWGSYIFLSFPGISDISQFVVYLFAFSVTFASTGIQSPRLVLAFNIPVLILAWLAMSLWGQLSLPVNTLLILLSFVSSTQLMLRARQRAKGNTRLKVQNERSLSQQLAAEEDLRRSEAEAAKAEQKRQKQLSRMQRDLVNAVPFPLVLTHKNEALEITPQARAQFGLEETDITAFTLTDFFRNPQDQQAILDILGAEGKLDDYEVLMHGTSGEDFWVTLSMRPLEYDGRDCWLNAIYVIDTRKRMEQDLAVAKEAAEATLEELKATQDSLVHAEKMASLGQLTAGIAHEIKNPLNFVNNFAKLSAEMMDELVEVLEEPIAQLDEDDREDAQDLVNTVKENLLKIDQHGRRADSIVKNMLLHSREGSSERQRIDLNTLAQEAMNLAYHGARAADKEFNVELQTEFSEDVGDVDCLPQDLQRVILNLCSNGMYEAVKKARDSESSPKIRLGTRVVGESIVVDISDNGGGIPDNVKDKIFNPFFTTKPTGEGTGLGLSMSFDIVKQHGGDMTFETAEGEGTTFSVRLPRAKHQGTA